MDGDLPSYERVCKNLVRMYEKAPTELNEAMTVIGTFTLGHSALSEQPKEIQLGEVVGRGDNQAFAASEFSSCNLDGSGRHPRPRRSVARCDRSAERGDRSRKRQGLADGPVLLAMAYRNTGEFDKASTNLAKVLAAPKPPASRMRWEDVEVEIMRQESSQIEVAGTYIVPDILRHCQCPCGRPAPHRQKRKFVVSPWCIGK